MVLRCSKCKVEHPLDAFDKASTPRGFQWYCREATNASKRARHAAFRAAKSEPPAPPAPQTPPPARNEPLAPTSFGPVRHAVYLFDIHRSVVEFGFWTAILQYLKDSKPEVVVLGGDVEDWEAFSRHVPGHAASPGSDSYRSFRLCLREVRHAAPGAGIVVLEGNHEEWVCNMMRESPDVARFHGLVSTPEDVAKEEGASWVGTLQQPFCWGQVRAYHGHQLFAGKFAPMHHAAKAADLYGRPDTIIAYGHTHQSQSAELAFIAGPGQRKNRRADAVGAVRGLNPAWKRGKPDRETNEFLIAYHGPGGTQTHKLKWLGTHFLFGSRIYSADSARYGRDFGHLNGEPK